ncbi:MAG: glycosyltransferase family 2 protein [Pirellulaceae bacterium]|nr:glycosyltransferase family 2 protein [Pirellulaceae bacterium]
MIVPCYNEQDMITYTVPHLANAFTKSGYRLQLVLVDNGSSDDTGAIIGALCEQYPLIVSHRVEINEGYGHGILSGLSLCTAAWIGIIPADGQIDAEDVVRLYEAVRATPGNVVGKVRRRFRMDGMRRKIVSVTYNIFFRLLWPSIRSVDVNGTPKILPRHAIMNMRLQSKGWMLDPEIMVKGHYLGLNVLEFNAFGRMRSMGTSQVRPSSCWEFFWQLLRARITGHWRRQIVASLDEAALPAVR